MCVLRKHEHFLMFLRNIHYYLSIRKCNEISIESFFLVEVILLILNFFEDITGLILF